jgi:hypothetical protein
VRSPRRVGDSVPRVSRSPGHIAGSATGKAKGPDRYTYLAEDETGLPARETVSIQLTGKKHTKHRKEPYPSPANA